MAADRNFAIWLAWKEYDWKVSMKDYPNRVIDYISVSTGKSWNAQTAVTQSWCGHFVYWVLHWAGIAHSINRDGPTIGRFVRSQGGRFQDYSVAGGKSSYTPQSGDLYYQIYVNGKRTDHIGFVWEPQGAKMWTIDGNSGPSNGAGFLLTKDKATGKYKTAGIGAGMVWANLKEVKNVDAFIDLSS